MLMIITVMIRIMIIVIILSLIILMILIMTIVTFLIKDNFHYQMMILTIFMMILIMAIKSWPCSAYQLSVKWSMSSLEDTSS